jgi:hypothetical protein
MFENLATATGSKTTPSRKGDTSAVMSAQVRLGTSFERNFYAWIKIMLNAGEGELMAAHSGSQGSTSSTTIREEPLASALKK